VPSRAGSARRYADALFSIAKDRGSEDAFLAELERLAVILRDEKAASVFISPRLTLAQKRDLAESLAGPFSRETLALLQMLLERKRIEVVPALAEAFADLVREAKGIERAEVRTAVALAPDEEQMVTRWLEARTGRRVEIESHVDPEIIGGVVARVGDQLIDASVRGRLEALRKRLKA